MNKIVFFITILFLNVITINKIYANTVFFDDFNGNDGTPLITHNNFWQTIDNTNFGILNNNEVKSSSGSNSIYYVPFLNNLTDYCVQADFTHPLPQTAPLDFFGLQTRQDNISESHFYEMQIGANDNIYFVIFHNQEIGDYQIVLQQPITISDGPHVAKLCSIGSNHNLYIDNNLIKTITDSTYMSGAPGFSLGNNTPIDNFRVDTVPSSDLDVPLLKQGILPFNDKNPSWEGDEFDHASDFGGFACGTTIAQCGCAMTSTAMIFEYYGIDQLPDKTFINPGTLNAWLKNNNGYFRDEGLNPYVAATVAKKAKSLNYNFAYDALEYTHMGEDKNQLAQDIQQGIPDILEEPGHFIVAKGINGNTFDINDPYYSRTTLDAYNNHFLSLGRFVGANSDPSYIVLAVDKNVSATLTNQQGASIGNSYLNYSLINPSTVSGIATPNPSLKILDFAKPSTGSYKFNLNASTLQTYQADIYVIDQNGNNKMITTRGTVGPGTTNTITLNFDKNQVSNSLSKKIVTFDSTVQDIKNADNLHLLNNILSLALITIVKSAQTEAVKHPQIAKTLLVGGVKILNDNKNHPLLLSTGTYSILSEDFSSLINAL
ncbi:MAG TPA: C39 family peptidase [Candidatus Saccharimonadales bacterium]|nr:C39 family peptidase [Candidatus Saccharimonadales bacterium]